MIRYLCRWFQLLLRKSEKVNTLNVPFWVYIEVIFGVEVRSTLVGLDVRDGRGKAEGPSVEVPPRPHEGGSRKTMRGERGHWKTQSR